MSSHPLSGLLGRWEDVMDDMEATAAAYREEGWETFAVHPGDVTPLPPTGVDAGVDQVGLDVLVPGDEFEEVEALAEDASFDEYEAFRAQEGGVVFLVVAMKAPDAGRVVLVPAYYALAEARIMLESARAEGVMRLYVRPLSDDRRVVFEGTDPERLFPEEEAESGDGTEAAAATDGDGTDGGGFEDADDVDGADAPDSA